MVWEDAEVVQKKIHGHGGKTRIVWLGDPS